MGNDRLSGKQVGSQASRRVTRRLAWIQPVCISKSINAVPALKGLYNFESEIDFQVRYFFSHCWSKAYNILHICGLKACSNSRLVRYWHNLELEHELDLRLKKFYKHCPRTITEVYEHPPPWLLPIVLVQSGAITLYVLKWLTWKLFHPH